MDPCSRGGTEGEPKNLGEAAVEVGWQSLHFVSCL